ncbi:helix-turn-helix domain-containing protein [Kineosporia sp. R_H_3]|uniref:helix-turn-helix domain-containing protein n=1 Tax=Kineosporia sp. R_H_3 TaxID=1961848 RepID=UPI000B4BCAC9|nr:helix-turn-helix domain-containing protein [Kineosporia sp. R_H_3]
MTATLDDVQTADSRIAAPASSAIEDGARESADSAGRFVPSDAVQSAGLLLVEERFSIVPEWVLDADVSDAAVRLYAVLLRFGQSSGQRMPSRRTLADRLRKKSVDTVDRALKELVGIGAVEVTRRFRDGVSLTNRYLVRTTQPGTTPRPGRGWGSRRDAATPDDRGHTTVVPVCSGSVVEGGKGRRGGRRSAATPGRTNAAGVAARMRPDPEFLTQTNPPPGPSSPPRTADADDSGDLLAGTARRAVRAVRRSQLLAAVGVADLDDVAARCVILRRQLCLPAGLWTADRLTDVLADAVLDHGLPPAAAIPALLAVAADPATRSPARVRCPGPWWDATTTPGASGLEAVDHPGERAELAELEAVLAELDGRRVAVQREARAQLAAEGLPLTRRTVARRAVDLALAQRRQETACREQVLRAVAADAVSLGTAPMDR